MHCFRRFAAAGGAAPLLPPAEAALRVAQLAEACCSSGELADEADLVQLLHNCCEALQADITAAGPSPPPAAATHAAADAITSDVTVADTDLSRGQPRVKRHSCYQAAWPVTSAAGSRCGWHVGALSRCAVQRPAVSRAAWRWSTAPAASAAQWGRQAVPACVAVGVGACSDNRHASASTLLTRAAACRT